MARQAMNGNPNGKTRKRPIIKTGEYTLIAKAKYTKSDGNVYSRNVDSLVDVIRSDNSDVYFLDVNGVECCTDRDNII